MIRAAALLTSVDLPQRQPQIAVDDRFLVRSIDTGISSNIAILMTFPTASLCDGYSASTYDLYDEAWSLYLIPCAIVGEHVCAHAAA